MSVPRISPSILSADFAQLAAEVAEVEAGGADSLHVDVMDGCFVPNLTLGPMVVKALRPHTKLDLDVHLMLRDADAFLDQFAHAGADTISVHAEACTHLQRTLSQVKNLGKRAGIALNPHTHEACLEYVWQDLDRVTVMSVNPGFGGQKFLTSQLKKIERIAERIQSVGQKVELEVDGGITTRNIRQLTDAGATIIVAGAAVFGQTDRKRAIAELRAAAGG